MSVQSIDQFRAQVAGDPQLQARFIEALAEGPAALAVLGRKSGHEFSEAEASDAITRVQADGELTDFELELVAGGDSGGSGCPSTAYCK